MLMDYAIEEETASYCDRDAFGLGGQTRNKFVFKHGVNTKVCFAHDYIISQTLYCRAQWLRGRASDSQLREPGFKSCAAVLGKFSPLHCSSSLSCINEYLAIDSGGYAYEQPSRINRSIWLDAFQRSRDGV